jgi:hypothetical protein
MPKTEMKVVHFGIKDFMLLSPRPDTCQECATKHDPALPHNQQSLFYQYKFFQEHDRWPTWADAMAHCTEDMKTMWIKVLLEHGVEVPR